MLRKMIEIIKELKQKNPNLIYGEILCKNNCAWYPSFVMFSVDSLSFFCDVLSCSLFVEYA